MKIHKLFIELIFMKVGFHERWLIFMKIHENIFMNVHMVWQFYTQIMMNGIVVIVTAFFRPI